MTLDAEGFLAPVVDAEKCVGCKLCAKACPILNPPKLERVETPKVYACWNNNEKVRFESSSGGMFSVYAEKILADGGVVFGAVYDESMKVVLAKAETSEDLARFRSSKYVQAEVGAIYRDVKRELKSSRPVLFVGTPCQVGGLYGYLGTDYDNLYTCDLICHGAPTPVLYDKWLKHLEKKLGGNIVSLSFRAKKKGDSHHVKIETQNSTKSIKTLNWHDKDVEYVNRMFIKNLCLRNSCSTCPFSKIPRIGDVTLGDFWGLDQKAELTDEVKRGVSLNVVNSSKGSRLVEKCNEHAVFLERSVAEARTGNPNLYSSSVPHAHRRDFLRDVQNLDYEQLREKYRKILKDSSVLKMKRRIVSLLRRIAKSLQ